MKEADNHRSDADNKHSDKLDKRPMIRLKLKVPAKVKETVSDTDKAHKTEVSREKDDIPTVTHEIRTQIHTHTEIHTPTLSRFYGTFKYRPFKLFPLLPPSSRYRVLIPASSTHHLPLNPALKLDYLWSTPLAGVYTDDSDLVCVLLREGWIVGEEVKGKNILVEVEVVDIQGESEKDEKNDNSTGGNSSSNQSNHTHKHTHTQAQTHTYTHNQSRFTVTPRSFPNHDGYHFRVTSCTIDPSAVHLKRWRKHKAKPNSDDPLTTPKFKTKSQ